MSRHFLSPFLFLPLLKTTPLSLSSSPAEQIKTHIPSIPIRKTQKQNHRTEMNRRFLEDADVWDAPIGPPSTTHFNTTSKTTNNTVYSYQKPFGYSSTFDSSMAITVVVLLTALFFMGFFSVYIRHFTEANAAVEMARRRRRQRATSSSPSSSSSSQGLDPVVIRALPVLVYERIREEGYDCAVCLTEFEEKEKVKMIPNCKHVFHPQCIDLWFSNHVSCPLCRRTQLFPPCPTSYRIEGICLDILGEEKWVVGSEDGGGYEAETSGNGDGFEEKPGELMVLRRSCSWSSSCSKDRERVGLSRCCSF